MGVSRFARLRGALPVSQWLGGAAGVIKSIQRNTITLADSVTSNTATISAVSMANSRLVYLGHSSVNTGGGGSGSGPTLARVEFTNATTITATRTTGTDAVIVSFEVIEYFPGIIRTVQRDTVTATGAASGTDTLSPTLGSIERATLDVLGFSGAVAFSADNFEGRVVLTNTTTVTLTRAGTNGNLTAGYQVVEWF